ncbi:MAG TPA: hypothetical protein VGF67_25600 [Ktedonobacteraceae bacterium]
MATGRVVFSKRSRSGFQGLLVWSPDRKRLACFAWASAVDVSYQLQVYTTASWQALAVSPAAPVVSALSQCLAWSPDSRRLTIASGQDQRAITIYDLATGTVAVTHQSPTGPVALVAWSPGTPLLASVYSSSGQAGIYPLDPDRTVEIWSATSGQTLFTYTAHTAAVNALVWSPAGELIASASADSTVRVWRPPPGAR